jgi:hypothetical protein
VDQQGVLQAFGHSSCSGLSFILRNTHSI